MKKFAFTLAGLASMTLQTAQWKNWAKNQRCAVKLLMPKNMQDLINLITKAQKEKARVRAYGTGHSWSDIVCVDGYLVNTDKLNKIVSVNAEKKQVTVQAGIKLKDLNKQLAKLGLCLSNQGAITEQSLAGIVSTATHGSGKTGTFASFITQVQLLTADGQLKNCSITENSALFDAARTSIGSLGIMTELTVQCEPLFKVQRTQKLSNWQTILKEYKQLIQANDFMQFYWNVANDSVEITMHNRIKDESKSPAIGYSYEMLSNELFVIYIEEEIAVPLKKFVEAAQAARKLVQKNYQKSSMFDGILFRFVSREEHNLLSPAADRDVVFFSITTSSRSGYKPFYKEFYNLMLAYEGRPHWGKINYLTKKDTRQLYDNNYDAFVKIRKQLDPEGMFSNRFTKRIFGW